MCFLFAQKYHTAMRFVGGVRKEMGIRTLFLSLIHIYVGIKGGIQVQWKESDCIQCGVCVKACRSGAITLTDGKISIDESKCNYCGRCTKACPTNAYDETHGYIV